MALRNALPLTQTTAPDSLAAPKRPLTGADLLKLASRDAEQKAAEQVAFATQALNCTMTPLQQQALAIVTQAATAKISASLQQTQKELAEQQQETHKALMALQQAREEQAKERALFKTFEQAQKELIVHQQELNKILIAYQEAQAIQQAEKQQTEEQKAAGTMTFLTKRLNDIAVLEKEKTNLIKKLKEEEKHHKQLKEQHESLQQRLHTKELNESRRQHIELSRNNHLEENRKLRAENKQLESDKRKLATENHKLKRSVQNNPAAPAAASASSSEEPARKKVKSNTGAPKAVKDSALTDSGSPALFTEKQKAIAQATQSIAASALQTKKKY